jgi:hypothetical protein
MDDNNNTLKSGQSPSCGDNLAGTGKQKRKRDGRTKRRLAAAHHELGKLAYDTNETAHVLGVDPRSVRRLKDRGLLRPSMALRKPLFSIDEIRRFLEETSK